MLPLQQSYEVKHSILEYLKATYSFKDKAVHEAFYRFITDENNGIFKGPYVSLKLPFVKMEGEDRVPLEIGPAYPPYDHQLKSFKRLTTEKEHAPQPTLITTGTSSGKTECFLFPVVDHCFKQEQRRGVKVIILYPMNALATDQAKRLAEVIWNDPRLKGKITAGLFIGEGKERKKFPTEMGEKHIIENRDTILENPPDILLTNFKMLDYALMRDKYHKLWSFNFDDTSLLQFLVLDELHTYDGAQGTDVANLIRRLKLKLNIPKGQICPVGTSATMGKGPDAALKLTNYASKVFGEDFAIDAVISENRMAVADFFPIPEAELEKYVPRAIGLQESRLQEQESYEKYINRQKRLWQIPESLDASALGEELKKLQIVKDLVDITGERILLLEELIAKLADRNPGFRRLSEQGASDSLKPREEVINSLLALVSAARSGPNGRFPFLFLQIQIWVREVTGILREISNAPIFSWKDKVTEKGTPVALPPYFCRECGASGWLGVKDDNRQVFSANVKNIYDYYFSNHKNVYFLNTVNHRPLEEYVADDSIEKWLHQVDLTLHDSEMKETVAIHAVRKLRDARARHVCPECNTENTISVIGARLATLSSITVAQVLSSDLDQRADKERKILAFTNSVQDAAHQAGFVESRNYRFTFRASLQKIINQFDKPIRLTELEHMFIEYWKRHSDPNGNDVKDAYYYRFFPADYEGRVVLASDYRDLAKNFTQEFKREFDVRMSWEIMAEFGYNAIIGRTLEKTGSSGVYFDPSRLAGIYPLMSEWLSKNNLAHITEGELIPFVVGVLHRVRTRGGIDHAYLSKARTGRLGRWELNWQRDGRHFLNRYFGPQARLPKVIGTEAQTGEMLDVTYTTRNNWYRSYFRKSFPQATDYHEIINDFFRKLFDVFCETELMNKQGTGGDTNYALQPSAILVAKGVKTQRCSKCSMQLHVALEDIHADRTACLDYECTGVLSITEKANLNYYQLVYNRNQSPRIFAAEHTGILERRDREKKEIDFKERPHFNSLNTIVATSTLEMGIDIGTLNTAINNSVPPLTSNFLQRVGRAGRSSGSALITNFAQGKVHDLYYFEEPRDMMEGEVATPGCFLEAREILHRHYFAYCLDSWVTADPVNHKMPAMLRTLSLRTVDITASDFWVNRIVGYMKDNERQLQDRFTDFYRPDMQDEQALKELSDYVNSDGLPTRLKRVFSDLKEEYMFIARTIAQIDAAKAQLPDDEERRALEQDRKTYRGLQNMLDKRSVLEHLTNMGLLPNYAFPETGVTLNAWVGQAQAKGSDSIPSNMQFEIVRSSKSAIREFAPDNYFYSQGFKFNVSGINTYSWRESGVLMEQRFCSTCDHLAPALGSNEVACPKCGDPSWSSERNKHVFVKLQGVKSVDKSDLATLNDDSDDRDSKQYRMSRHYKFDKNAFQGAWGMREIPFGIEYVKNLDIVDVNLGLSSAVHANKIDINQLQDVPSHGFVTCRHCGRSTSRLNSTKVQFHYGYCKHKEHPYSGAKDEVFEEVFLLRELKTEALKILLPVQEFEDVATINMFKAGLELGLKKYYGGNPQHIEIAGYAEYNEQNGRFDKYLIMHDLVPGGTGYLGQLFDPAEFTRVIRQAYEAIRDCSCKAKGHDGCYRCIYTYTNQNIQQELSRSRAEKLFHKIVEKADAWEEYNTGLSMISGDGRIEESELEDRFIRSLRTHLNSGDHQGNRFEDFMQDGVMNYKFRITKGEVSYNYMIRPQIDLGPANGVAMHTRPDFMISLTSAVRNGLEEELTDSMASMKSVAVYLDGYTFHATENNFNFYDDLLKRRAIAASGSIMSWSLTWADMDRFDIANKDTDSSRRENRRDSLYMDRNRFRGSLDVAKKLVGPQALLEGLFETENSMERLLWRLSCGLSVSEIESATGLYLSCMRKSFILATGDASEIDTLLPNTDIPLNEDLKATKVDKGEFYAFPEPQPASDIATLRTGVMIKNFSIKSHLITGTQPGPYPKEQWELFWQVYNLVQEGVDI